MVAVSKVNGTRLLSEFNDEHYPRYPSPPPGALEYDAEGIALVSIAF
jgi:hypothetical protein